MREKVAKKLGISVEILRQKGERLKNSLSGPTKKYYKKPTTTIQSDTLQKLENSLLAIKIYGGLTEVKIPFQIPEDETKLSELELIFNSEHELSSSNNLEKETRELLSRYENELTKQKISVLTKQLETLDEESDEYIDILREIQSLQHSV